MALSQSGERHLFVSDLITRARKHELNDGHSAGLKKGYDRRTMVTEEIRTIVSLLHGFWQVESLEGSPEDIDLLWNELLSWSRNEHVDEGVLTDLGVYVSTVRSCVRM